MKGVKFDSNKVRHSLLPRKTLQRVLEVLEVGAKKYSEGNWLRVENAETRYFDAAHRHLEAYWRGELNDPETGLPHLAHAISNLLFLLYFQEHKNEQTDIQ